MANTYKQQLATQIATLSDRVTQWENDQLKAANEKLYEILEDCFTLFRDVASKDANAKALNSLLTDMDMKPKSNTSLALRVVRAVFGKEGKREMAYARVLKVANAEIADGQSLTSFIQERGGIEEIRRKPSSQANKLDSEDYRAIARNVFSETSNTLSSYQLPRSVKLNETDDSHFAVAIVRVDSAARAHILHNTTQEKVVNAALAVAGKELHDQRKECDALEDHDSYIASLTQTLTQFHADLQFDASANDEIASETATVSQSQLKPN